MRAPIYVCLIFKEAVNGGLITLLPAVEERLMHSGGVKHTLLVDAGCGASVLWRHFHFMETRKARSKYPLFFIHPVILFIFLHNKRYLRENTHQCLRLQISIREQSHLTKKIIIMQAIKTH